MNILRGLALCGVLIFTVVVKDASCKRKILGGYVPGVSGMPPIDKANCDTEEILKNPKLSNALECARTCHYGEKPKTCYYKFVVERYPVSGQACTLCTPNVTNSICPDCQCIPADGVERMALTVNRMIPGPSVQVCLNDFVVVDVVNKIKEDALTIHWHGIYQKGYQYSDGVPELTQCPITYSTVFRYQFRVQNAGTHFWHAHSGLHKMDGVFGSFIVRDPEEQDPHRNLYDFDLANHVVVINDWMHEEATERYPGRNGIGSTQAPDTFLINGRGWVMNENITAKETDLEVITVEPNKRYRFRLVNSFCTICPGQFMIEGHNLTVIATDGLSNEAVVVDGIVTLPAERYDFVLHTNQRPGAYWIQVRGLNRCEEDGIHQLAILQYKNAPKKPLSPKPTYDSLPAKIILNPVDIACNATNNPTRICIHNLTSTLIVDSTITAEKVDVQNYMPIGFRNPSYEENYRPHTYNDFLIPVPDNVVQGIMDNIQFNFPPSPPLSQYEDLPPGQFCNAQTLPGGCTTNCSCTHVIPIKLHSVVEIILIDVSGVPGLTHPFHLHGHGFNVLSMGQPLGPYTEGNRITVDYVKQLDKKNNLNRRYDNPAAKDTLALPNNGYAVLRFRASNPGYWLFHCHFVYHQNSGMELVIKVGEQSDLPPVPKNFPRCGHFKPRINPFDNRYGDERSEDRQHEVKSYGDVPGVAKESDNREEVKPAHHHHHQAQHKSIYDKYRDDIGTDDEDFNDKGIYHKKWW